eukprot:m.13671 g.13671  ORF g.13671 m.13671 type:complete len:234 (-) comp4897_c0_seq1:33-734(-)
MLNVWYKDTNKEELIKRAAIYGPLRNVLAQKTCKILSEWKQTENRWFLESGTLLGAYRGAMIPHDDDFDLGVVPRRKSEGHGDSPDNIFSAEETMEEFLEVMCKKFQSAGLHARVTKTYNKKVEVFDPEHGKFDLGPGVDFHHVTVDVTVFPLHPEKSECITHPHYTMGHVCIPWNELFPTESIMYEKLEFQAPKNVQLTLESFYGYLGKDSCFNPETNLYEKKKPEGDTNSN